MPANIASSSKRTATELEAELAALEDRERAIEAQRKHEREEKKKKLAELAEAKKVEEAAAEAARKAAAEKKRAGKQKAIESETDEDGDSVPKKNGKHCTLWVRVRRWHGKCATSACFVLIFFLFFLNSFKVYFETG